MTLLMLATPLAMRDEGVAFPQIARTIQLHVLAMYIPSFFTGNLIDRFGSGRVLMAGVAVLALSVALNFLSGVPAAPRYMAALIALGLGWNFLFVAASAVVAKLGRDEARARLQGLNEAIILLAAASASFAAGPLYGELGWLPLNLAALPVLVAAAVCVVWLGREFSRETRGSEA